MSAPLSMSPNDVRRLAKALDLLSAMTRETDVRIDAYDSVALAVTEDAQVRIGWDKDEREYIVDDWIGR